jgi:hypothetical protein
MENKEWMRNFLEGKRSYTKEDILHIVGERLYFKPDKMKEDIGKILGSPSCVATSSKTAGSQYP